MSGTEIVRPVDGSTITRIPIAGSADVDRAFLAAQQAQPAWGETPPTERGRILRRVEALMLDRVEELAAVESENTGFPISACRAMARRAAGTFGFFGGYADKVLGSTIEVDTDYHVYTRREPFGTVVAIVPWNAPLIFATKKIAPAIAFGNACILKPAAESPLTALLLADIMAEAGVPEGVAQIVTGERETGSLLTSDPRADLIVFTGSDATGKHVARAAAENLVPVALELGGKSPQIVFDDADLDRALEWVMLGIYSETGQACIAGSRLLLQDSVHDEFLDRLARETERLRVGDPADADTAVGPQMTKTQQQKTLGMIERALEAGARRVASAPLPRDPRLAEGFFVPPTVFADVDLRSELMRDEVFGPVIAAARFSDEAEAIALANDTRFGLAAGIWTGDLGRAHRVARSVRAGNVYLNSYFEVSDQVPFGGMGMSGFGREGGQSAIDLYTQVKTVWTSMHTPASKTTR